MKDDPLADAPFDYQKLKDGGVRIFHRNRLAKALSGADAAKFLGRIERSTPQDAQQIMAKATGQFRFGNERQGKTKGRGR